MMHWFVAIAIASSLTTHAPVAPQALQAPPAVPAPVSPASHTSRAASVRGVVIDSRSRRPIADAAVSIVESGATVRTTADGRFAFAGLAPGPYTLTVSTVGYIFVRRAVVATDPPGPDLVVPLAEGTGTYQETVTVSAEAAAPRAVGLSSQFELGSAALAELRGVAADDPMRAVQALPGVATGDDFQAQFSVRGSAFRHVGVVIDGTPTQLLLHAIRGTNETGSVAMVNSDVLSRAGLASGAQSRRHGDWLGATLDFEIREGSRDRLSARAAVSGTSASAVFEGPIGSSHRGSWLVSIRRSYLDWIVRRVAPDIDSTIGFTDVQAKLAFDLTDRQQLQLVALGGDAGYREVEASPINGILRARSRSALASLQWRYARTRALFSQRLSVLAGDYRNTGVFGQRLAEGTTQSAIWRSDIVLPLRPWLTVEGGARYETTSATETLRRFQSNGAGGVRVRFSRAVDGSLHRTSGWGEVTWRTSRGGMAAGLRATASRDAGANATFWLPWLLGEYRVGQTVFRAGFGRSAQFHDPLLVPILVEPSTAERASSYDASLEQLLPGGFGLQATGYYRTERDVLRRAGEDRLDPITGLRIAESTFPLIAPTLAGTSRGIDLTLIRRGTSGPTGWVSYSWARTRYDDRVTGERFEGDFDQRHTLNIFVQQRLSYRLTVSGKVRIGSNFPIVGYFEGDTESLWLSAVRNAARLPTYARVDVRANRTFTFARSRLTLFVEIMNVLGRDNLRQTDGSIRANLQAVGYTDRLIPRVPSAGFLLEF
jgi:hypothetical protein